MHELSDALGVMVYIALLSVVFAVGKFVDKKHIEDKPKTDNFVHV